MSEINSPAIRFAGFTEDWEERKLGEVATFRRGLTYHPSNVCVNGVRVLRSSNINEDSFVLKDDDIFVKQSAINIDFAKKNDILITAANGSSRLVGKHALITKLVENVVHGGFMLLASSDNPAFVNALMSSPWYSTFINIHVAGGNGAIGNLSKRDLEDQSIFVPSATEQKQIGEFFTSLDRLITLHQREHDKTVNIKKALLEKMFPKDGEDKPAIRFAGFTDAWESRKLGELALSFEYGLNAAATAFDGIHKYIRITDIDEETHEFKFDSLTTPDVNLKLADSYLLKEGDVLFARTGASVGKTYQYKEHDGLVYFAGFLIRARINPKYDSEFVFQNTLTRKYNSFIATTSQRSGQPGVNAVEYADYEILVPKLDEQKAIGIFLSKLDRLIAQHQRELTKLQNIKKALLEKMFV